MNPARPRPRGPHPGPDVRRPHGPAAGLAAAHPRPALPPGRATAGRPAHPPRPRGTLRRRAVAGGTSEDRDGPDRDRRPDRADLPAPGPAPSDRSPRGRSVGPPGPLRDRRAVRGVHLGRAGRHATLPELRPGGPLRRARRDGLVVRRAALARAPRPPGLARAALGALRGDGRRWLDRVGPWTCPSEWGGAAIRERVGAAERSRAAAAPRGSLTRRGGSAGVPYRSRPLPPRPASGRAARATMPSGRAAG